MSRAAFAALASLQGWSVGLAALAVIERAGVRSDQAVHRRRPRRSAMIGHLFVIEQAGDCCLRPAVNHVLPKNLSDDLLLSLRSRPDHHSVCLQMLALTFV